MPGGFVGVDVFFVISGFLITGIIRADLAEGRFLLIGFYERRARRILPALFAMIATSFIVGWIVLLPDEFIAFALSAIATTSFGSNVWFWSQLNDYFSPAAEFAPLLHTWTLAVEEQFYIIFPLLLMGLARWRADVSVWAMAVLCVASFALAVYGVARMPAATFYLAPTRAWELGFGALLALGICPKLESRWLLEGSSATGLVLILGAVVFYSGDTPFPGLAALAPCIGAALVIHSGGLRPTMTSRLLSLRPVVFVGLISYSLYLWHWPILAFLRLRLVRVDLPAQVAAGAVAAAFIAATLSWILIERPLRDRNHFTRHRIFALSAVTMVATVSLSANVWYMNGWPDRFSTEALIVYDAAHDNNPDFARCWERLPDDGLCIFGAEAEQKMPIDFLLWGDSHANAIMPGIATAAISAGKTGLFAGWNSCSPLLGGAQMKLELGQSHDCITFNSAVIGEIKARDDLPLVIIVGRWAYAAEGHGMPGEEDAPVLLPRVASGGSGNFHSEDRFKTFDQALSATVETI